MRSSTDFLRGMRILDIPTEKIKILVGNNNLKEDWFNRPKRYHRYQTEKMHQCPIYFSTRFLCTVLEPDD